MRDKLADLILAAVLSGLVFLAFQALRPKDNPAPAPAPAPYNPPLPGPCPGPGPCPVKPKRPWLDKDAPRELLTPDSGVGGKVGGRESPTGTPIQIDLPNHQHMKNVGGSDGAGLCVFTSIAHAARWQNIPLLSDFRDWMRKYPGGGYPTKVDTMIKKIAAEKNAPLPSYIQVEDNDYEILKLACKTGRMPCVTYSYSPTGRYNGQRIAHMVNISHADDKSVAVLDNNYPGADSYEWLTPQEFMKTYSGGGTGWSVIFLNFDPPPVPKLRK